MSPLEKIKKGITTENMSLVAEAYKDLTGETVAAKQPAKKRKAKPAIDLDMADYAKPDKSAKNNIPADRAEKVEARTGSVRIGKRVNLFNDDLSESLEFLKANMPDGKTN